MDSKSRFYFYTASFRWQQALCQKMFQYFEARGRNDSDHHTRDRSAGSGIDNTPNLPYHGEVHFMYDTIGEIPANAASLMSNHYIQHPHLSLQPYSCKCRSNADHRYR